MKFRVNSEGKEYLNWQDFMDPIIREVYFDFKCEWCLEDKEQHKECDECGAPSRFYVS